MAALDAINKRFGRGAIRFGAEGVAEAPWRMQYTRRSPQYTSVWEELPIVSVTPM